MQYRKLGNSSLKPSVIGFGCMSLHDSHPQNLSLLREAHELGINFFDTADLYDRGENEIMLGKAVKPFRDQVYIATKVGNQWRSDGSGWDWNPRKAYILQAVEKSLQRLQTDYVDLYQLHGGTIDDPIDETIEAFELLVEQGKIRSYGISSIRPNVIREYVKRSRIDSVMMQYSLLDRRPEEACLDLLHEHGISVLSRGSLAKGLLAGKPSAPYLEWSATEVEKIAQKVREVGRKEQLPAEKAAAYVLQAPAVSTAVIGIRTRQQLQQAVAIGDAEPLTGAEMQELQENIPVHTYQQHR